MANEGGLIAQLPPVRGKLREKADLSNWFQAGGPAEVLFKPEDKADLASFIATIPANIPLTVLGVGSNLLIRDGGIDGVVIRLGKGFNNIIIEDDTLIVGAGCLNSNVARAAKEHGIGGLEFLSGIPGGIGGALAMNAGAYGIETKDVLVEAEAVDNHGNIDKLTPDKLGYTYRHCSLPQGWIFTQGTFRGRKEHPDKIAAVMDDIFNKRNSTQPIRTRTGGSTFKNPEGHKAWQLIDEAGCRGLRHGGAQISELHCNFMINADNATADDLETLGEIVRKKVFEHCGIMLEWEIKVIGKKAPQQTKNNVAT